LWSIIGGMAVLVVSGVALRSFFEGRGDGAVGVPGGGDAGILLPVAGKTAADAAARGGKTPGNDEAARVSAGNLAEVLVDAEPVVRRFVAARSVEDLLPWVRNPVEEEPRMRKWYREHPFDDLQVKEFGVNRAVRFLNGLAWVSVKTSDFNIRQIVVGKTADGFKVDWPSWVGWSEMSWKKLREMRPVEPQLFRVSAELGKYYNFGFSDDEQWRCYQLGAPDGIDFIYGYVRRGSELDMKMAGVTDKPVALTLRIHFPENAPSDNQVFIDSLVAQGWVVGAGGEAEQ